MSPVCTRDKPAPTGGQGWAISHKEQGWGSNLMWAAHYLSGMAKALMDDAAEGLEVNGS
ncbi:DUF3077 domain-containing protein [Pseudomonas guariconensis]|uniref:DUF3077 domain-containing protein n=1 Tax=Pseudomonas guariconensis TaxID=1288410 RepID=UPI0018AA43E7|nr:DUF3077 domain-containing protein [Pseudomonas guariconensis]MBF8752728.1 DUF3077 domain-containing protein [Pseudomonas guariconensis]